MPGIHLTVDQDRVRTVHNFHIHFVFGAGLPGIPLAIIFPDRHFTLLDSNGKKIRFLFQVRHELNLNNIQEVQVRVEQFQPQTLFDGIISRAFANMSDFVCQSARLLKPDGRFYAMKGQYPTDELRELPKPYKVLACHELQVPDMEGERHLLEISHQRGSFEQDFCRR